MSKQTTATLSIAAAITLCAVMRPWSHSTNSQANTTALPSTQAPGEGGRGSPALIHLEGFGGSAERNATLFSSQHFTRIARWSDGENFVDFESTESGFGISDTTLLTYSTSFGVRSVSSVGSSIVYVAGRARNGEDVIERWVIPCLLYTSPSPRDGLLSRMPSSA